MVRLLILLLGGGFLRRQWKALFVIGIVTLATGVVTCIDALDGQTLVRPRHFGYFLLAEAVLSVPTALVVCDLGRRLRLAKSAILAPVAILILSAPWHGNFLLALTFGFAYACDGALRIACALVVKFATWRAQVTFGVVQLGFAIFMVEPWPTRYAGTIGFNVGLAAAMSGAGLLLLARQLRRLPEGVPLSSLLNRDVPAAWRKPSDGPDGVLTVHVWTPTSSIERDRSRRPLISRYIAAVDARGVISTGHVAIELWPDVYISHYPAQEIDRSSTDFARILRATRDNDMPGRFLPSYSEEASAWCPSTRQVRFQRHNAAWIRAFWTAYGTDATYNLTSRNCTSVAAQALDVALEGSLGRLSHPVLRTMRLLLSPELWIAAQMRRRAETMAWTPGLMLDYASALQALVEPPNALPLRTWLAHWSWRGPRILRRWRRRAEVGAVDALRPLGSVGPSEPTPHVATPS